MRYAIFTDIHANLEALEAVLAKIDEIAAKEPIDQIWFLGDLVGYGPNPNECILKLRDRTDVIIAGNHDWAAVGKIDLDEFSPAARISAEWTAEQLTQEHRDFLSDLPERIEKGECTLVHGSPYGPLWEYLTEEALAERSFECFTSRYCFVGHTHVPVIFQQPDIANTPTLPLGETREHEVMRLQSNGVQPHVENEDTDLDAGDDDETAEMATVRAPASPVSLSMQSSEISAASAFTDPDNKQTNTPNDMAQTSGEDADISRTDAAPVDAANGKHNGTMLDKYDDVSSDVEQLALLEADSLPPQTQTQQPTAEVLAENDVPVAVDDDDTDEFEAEPVQQLDFDDYMTDMDKEDDAGEATPESEIAEAEDRLNSEIEELLTLLGLSQSMVEVTNEMLTPPEGHWEAPTGYRAIVNPGGVGQPRDGDPRAAFMIYDSEHGFEFHRVAYDFEKTQEKIINAGLPQFLAVRLQYGR